MYMSGTLPAALLEVAARQHGLFGVQQAADVGVVDAVVRKLAARDVLERRAQRVYRIVALAGAGGRAHGRRCCGRKGVA